MVKRLLFWIIVLFINSSFVIRCSAFAEEAPRFYGEEVVVTAARLPQPASVSPWNTTIINARALKNYRTVGEALRSVAGVDTQSYGYLGALTSVRLRGASASQVLIMVDGKRLNSPTLGMFDLGDLLTDNVERIEVVRAPLSALYGSDAVSGAINIITRPPAAAEKAVAVSAGSFGTQQYKLAVAGASYLVAADYLRSDGFRRNGDYRAGNAYGKLMLPLTVGQLTVDYHLCDAEKGVPGVPTSEADPASASEPNDRQKDRNVIAGATLSGDNYQLRGYQNTYDQRLDPYIFGASRNQTVQTGLEWQQDLGGVLYGLEAREDRGQTTMSGDHTVRNYAAFAQTEFRSGRKYNVTVSLRGDKHSTAGTAVTPRVGVVYQLPSGLALKASAGSAFRAPTLNELYWNDGWMFGNTALKPERSFNYELGLERKLNENSSARLSYYVSTVTDMILWDWQSSTIETRARNIGEVRTEGVEFEFNRQIGEEGRAFVNYTYQKAVDQRDFDPLAVGKQVRYTPQTKYNAGLSLGGSSLIIKHVGERYADQYNTVRLAAYTVVDLKLAKQVRGAELELAVSNLLDEKYSEAVGNDPLTYAARQYPMPGRTYSLGLKWTW